ncbi:MAG: hypothetical protein LBU27_06705 [Candidatus Peribacteria bacterium]|jgi:hypothetical protein|nr:hypothetical protein [Candidatus Peribacteria bacterium]
MNTEFSIANEELLIQQLPEHLLTQAKEYKIPESFLKDNPDIVILILESLSISTHKDKQEWFDVYPLMNDLQIANLKDILTREKEKLAEIEQKYTEQQEEIGQSYLSETSQE